MKVSVDRALCQGNANCIDESAEVFAIDDEDRVVLRLAEPPRRLHDQVRFAALCCPRSAITIIDAQAAPELQRPGAASSRR